MPGQNAISTLTVSPVVPRRAISRLCRARLVRLLHSSTPCQRKINRRYHDQWLWRLSIPFFRFVLTTLATLESRIHAQEQGQFRWLDTSSLEGGDAMLPTTMTLPPTTTADLEMSRPDSNCVAMPSLCSPVSEPEPESFLNTFFDVSTVPATTMAMLSEHTPTSATVTGPSSINVTKLMQAELDQMYFDRVHAAIPILHQRRYMSRARSSVKTRSRECLQYAVWATASLMSAQFEDLRDKLYPELKRMLASTSLPPSSSGQQLAMDVELAQAWVLTATYEFIKTYHHEACISAGRAFRLVQLMRLHEVDLASNSSTTSAGTSGTDFIVTEEKRRVFWMAFILETLFSMRNNLPLVVNELMVSVRLFPNPPSAQTDSWCAAFSSAEMEIRRSALFCLYLINSSRTGSGHRPAP